MNYPGSHWDLNVWLLDCLDSWRYHSSLLSWIILRSSGKCNWIWWFYNFKFVFLTFTLKGFQSFDLILSRLKWEFFKFKEDRSNHVSLSNFWSLFMLCFPNWVGNEISKQAEHCFCILARYIDYYYSMFQDGKKTLTHSKLSFSKLFL